MKKMKINSYDNSIKLIINIDGKIFKRGFFFKDKFDFYNVIELLTKWGNKLIDA